MKKRAEDSNNENKTDLSAADKASGKKGRPTPKRKDAEKRNLRPLVVDSRKEKRARSREERNQALERQRAALEGRGNPKDLPVRDRGPIRRYVRDRIDARWSLTEFLLPLMLLALIPSFFLHPNSPWAYVPVITIYVLLLIAIGEMIWVVRSIKRDLLITTTPDKLRGIGMYATGRMLSPRRFRSPVAMVQRGEAVPLP